SRIHSSSTPYSPPSPSTHPLPPLPTTMLSTLTVVSFFFLVAWVQQKYLNRLMEADIEHLKSVRRQQLASAPDAASSQGSRQYS
ncbi:MAG: hypothetical protein AAFW75_22880, partial [Cyanobacteria bacterium J06636_16]